MSVRIDELGYFLAVAEEGNVRRAAERLGISQPALSKAIQKFEASLGFALFERTAKGMQLTRVGENFLTRTSVPHRQLNDAIEDAKDLHLGTLGLLRVGVSPIYLGSLFAPAFVELRRHRPASTVRLLTEFNNKLLQLLSQQQLDVAICGAKPDLPLNGFKRYGLLTDDIVIVVGEKHPLAHIARPSVADLAKFQWVLTRPEEAGRRLIEAEFFNAGLAPPTVALQLNTVTELLYSAVRDTDLVALATKSMMEGPKGCGMVTLPFSFPWMKLGSVSVFVSDSALNDPLAGYFCHLLQKMGRPIWSSVAAGPDSESNPPTS